MTQQEVHRIIKQAYNDHKEENQDWNDSIGLVIGFCAGVFFCVFFFAIHFYLF